MRPQAALLQGITRIKGLVFVSNDAFQSPEDLYRALVSEDDRKLHPDHIAQNLSARFAGLLAICLIHEDVYKRLRGGDAFWNLIQSTWTSPCLLKPVDIKKAVGLFVQARRRFQQNPTSNNSEVDRIIKPLDRFIRMTDDVNSSRLLRGFRNLNSPANDAIVKRMARIERGTVIWPPSYFGPLDIAILGESTLKKKLFGVNPQLKAEGDINPQYPNDQCGPMHARAYLSWLALTEITATSKVSLLLTPVAFIDHKQRQRWLKPTGSKARYYATVGDFIEYADHEFRRTGSESKKHVLALFTPWFFDIDQLAKDAWGRDRPIPVVWEKTCFRAGMMMALTRMKKASYHYTYRLIIFKPGRPSYARAAEPSERRPKQTAWIAEAVAAIRHSFTVEEVWIGGQAERHRVPNPSRGVSADSVELSAEIITEIIEDHSTLPTEASKLLDRRFVRMQIDAHRVA
ncbi:hypothetical protein F5Y19DRAFT_492089 [Xylariaceae sp. FL1651]|nr:hypothetical protein F5Y19DRAFT_492089 [Xylariaceae sp. FL1651]